MKADQKAMEDLIHDEKWLKNLEEVRQINKENIGGEFIQNRKDNNEKGGIDGADDKEALEKKQKEDEARKKQEQEAARKLQLAEEELLKKIEQEEEERQK